MRYAGIVAAARAAGVTREHAYRVLSGERQSARLLRLLKQHGLRPGGIPVETKPEVAPDGGTR